MSAIDTVKIIGSFIGLLIGLTFHFYFHSLGDQRDARKIKKALDQNTRLYEIYLTYLRRALDRLDEFFGKEPFGALSYGACLRFSLSYILVTVLLVWAFSGNDTSGLEQALPAGRLAWQRLVAAALCAAAFGCLLIGSKAGSAIRAIVFVLMAVSLSLLGSVVVSAAQFATVSAVTSAVVLSAYSTFTPAARPRTYPPTARLFILAGVGASIISLLILVFGTFADASTLGGLRMALGISVAAFGAGGVSYAWTWFELKNWGGLFHLIFWLLFVVIVLLSFIPPFVTYIPPEGRILGVFWLLLPLLNTPFDWVSLAITRILFRRTTNNGGRGAVTNALLDFTVASFLLVALAVTVTGFLSAINAVSAWFGLGRPVAVAETLRTLRDQTIHWDLVWVCVMICSTFVPSIVHLLLAAFATSTWAFRKAIGQFLAPFVNGNGKGSYADKAKGAFMLTLRDWVSYSVPVLMVVVASFTIYEVVPSIGHVILWVCERVAALLGERIFSEALAV